MGSDVRVWIGDGEDVGVFGLEFDSAKLAAEAGDLRDDNHALFGQRLSDLSFACGLAGVTLRDGDVVLRLEGYGALEEVDERGKVFRLKLKGTF